MAVVACPQHDTACSEQHPLPTQPASNRPRLLSPSPLRLGPPSPCPPSLGPTSAHPAYFHPAPAHSVYVHPAPAYPAPARFASAHPSPCPPSLGPTSAPTKPRPTRPTSTRPRSTQPLPTHPSRPLPPCSLGPFSFGQPGPGPPRPTLSAYSVCPVKRVCIPRSASVRHGLPQAMHTSSLICGRCVGGGRGVQTPMLLHAGLHCGTVTPCANPVSLTASVLSSKLECPVTSEWSWASAGRTNGRLRAAWQIF